VPTYDASTAECLLFTEKAGLLSSVAHDLKLLVTRFEVSVEGGAPRAKFDPSSVRVVCARRDGRDAPGLLSASDRAEIEKNIIQKVLEPGRYPSLEFHSTAISAHPPGGYRIDGVLTLHGREQPVAMLARKQGEVALIDGHLHQPDFGIVPYTAMLGALKIKPDVAFRLVVPWPKDPVSLTAP
jgi:hypothetical protein